MMASPVLLHKYEAAGANGACIDDIFENLLNKKTKLHSRSTYEEGQNHRIAGYVDDEIMQTYIRFVLEKTVPNGTCDKIIVACDTDIDIPIQCGEKVFFSGTNASINAIQHAYHDISSNACSQVLVLAVSTFTEDDIDALITTGAYATELAKPFDIDHDGINLARYAVALLFQNSGFGIELCSCFDDISSLHTELAKQDNNALYIEAAANGNPLIDRAEVALFAPLLTQDSLIASHKAFLGESKGAAAALSIAVAAYCAHEGFIPASSFLEHAFTNELSFVYANKRVSPKTILVSSLNETNSFSFFLLSAHA